ncbi:MAG: hypothetical protein WCX82_04685 [archaeon]|jgi:hypothetical protein
MTPKLRSAILKKRLFTKKQQNTGDPTIKILCNKNAFTKEAAFIKVGNKLIDVSDKRKENSVNVHPLYKKILTRTGIELRHTHTNGTVIPSCKDLVEFFKIYFQNKNNRKMSISVLDPITKKEMGVTEIEITKETEMIISKQLKILTKFEFLNYILTTVPEKVNQEYKKHMEKYPGKYTALDHKDRYSIIETKEIARSEASFLYDYLVRTLKLRIFFIMPGENNISLKKMKIYREY